MKYFKYLLFIILTLITTSSYSAYTCGVGADVTLISETDDYPTVLCANTGAGNCEVIENHSIRSNNGTWIIYATSTGEGCIAPTNLNAPPLDDGCQRTANGSIVCPEEEEEEDEDDPVLQCTTDSCPNPENKRCPTGYKPGSFNGQNICSKSKTGPNPDPEPCEGENCNPDEDVINSVNNANNSITGAIGNLSNSFSNSFNQIKNLLGEISEKIQNLGNGNGNGNGGGNGNGDGDGSELSAETPYSETQQQFLNENLFSSNDQCPPDNVLNLNFMSNNITYNFSYAEICNALYSLSFIVMILAYMVSIYIVSRE